MWSWPWSSKSGKGTWTRRWPASNGGRRAPPVKAGPRHLAQELLEWWEAQEALLAPTPLSPLAGPPPPSLASLGAHIWRDKTPACYRVPANFLNWQKTVTRNFIFRLVSWQDHGVQWLRVTQFVVTQCHVASRHVKPCHILSCHVTSSWHVFSISCSIMTPECGTSPNLRRTQNCLRGSPKPPKICWVPVSQIWAKNCPEFEAQDPLRCTDAITRGSTLYVIQRIWSCINQNLNLPPHVAWVTFRGQKLFGLVFSIDIWCAAMCAHADATLSQLLINIKRDKISLQTSKSCAQSNIFKKD